MFLSLLNVNVGSDPDRERPGRQWLRNVYHVHQRLWMAFPDAKRLADDPYFLGPWGGPPNQAPTPKRSDSGFLFRVERDGEPRILVQSAQKPNWEYAFQNAPYLLSEKQVLEFDLAARRDQALRFRILANPTKKIETLTKEQRHAKTPKRHGKRVPVEPTEESSRKWLERRAKGFRLIRLTSIQPGYVYMNKTPDAGKGQQLRSVLFEGVLEVTEPDLFRNTLIHGIGPAKAFGFGLLSVAPVAQA